MKLASKRNYAKGSNIIIPRITVKDNLAITKVKGVLPLTAARISILVWTEATPGALITMRLFGIFGSLLYFICAALSRVLNGNFTGTFTAR